MLNSNLRSAIAENCTAFPCRVGGEVAAGDLYVGIICSINGTSLQGGCPAPITCKKRHESSFSLKMLENYTYIVSCLVADKRAVLDNQRASDNVNGAALK